MNRKIRKLSQSFKWAFRGIRQCVQTERNLRIHICAAVYVTLFALIGRLDSVRCAVLCVCFALMMGAELMNTAIERLCDRHASGYDGAVRDAKDIAAGAVLVCALFSAAVGAMFFLRASVMDNIYLFLRDKLWLAGLVALSVPVSVAFIFDLKGKL